MSLKFECLTPEDFEAVCTFYDDVIAVNAGSKYDVLWRRDSHPSDAHIARALAAGEVYGIWIEGRLAVAGIFDQNVAAGYEAFPWRVPEDAGGILVLHLFATHPDFYRQGLAMQCLELAKERFRQQGVAGIRLDAFADNLPARKLYEVAGFQLIGEGHLLYADQDDTVAAKLFAMYELSLL